MSFADNQRRRGVTDPYQTQEPDYYAVLGVTPSAGEREIKQEFRRLAKLWHPDHFTAADPVLRDRAERRMQSLNRAYNVLSDPVKKVGYDQRRRHADGAIYGTYWTPGWSGAAYAQPEGGFRSGSPYSSGEYSWYSWNPWTQETYGTGWTNQVGRSNNPNGAGMLGGTLCLILALCTLWSISMNGLLEGLAPILGLAAFVVLLVLAGYLFDPKSPVSRAVRRFLERDPRPGWDEHGVWNQHSATENERPSWPSSGDRPHDTAFELLVDEALAGIPAEFHSYLENVVVRVKDEPSPDEIVRMKVRPCNLLLGLYEGTPLTHQGVRGHPPEVITIFQRPIESYCHDDPERIRLQVRATVLHELAHHFGMSHEEMPAWIK